MSKVFSASAFFVIFCAWQIFSAPLIICSDQRWQLVSNAGKILNSTIFDRVFYLENGCFWVTKSQNEMFSAQLLSPLGVAISDAKYSLYEDVAISSIPRPFQCGAILAQKKGQTFREIESDLLYPDGHIVNLGLSRNGSYCFSNFVTMAMSDGKYCLYDAENRIKCTSVVGDSLLFSGTSAVIVEEGGKKHLANHFGERIVAGEFDEVVLCLDSEDVVWLDRGHQRTLFDVKNAEILPLEVSGGWKSWPNGDIGRNVRVQDNGKWGIFSLSQKKYSIAPNCDDLSWATKKAIVCLRGDKKELVSILDGRVLAETYGEISRNLDNTSNGCELWEICGKDGQRKYVFINVNDVITFDGLSVEYMLDFKQNPPRCEMSFLIVKDLENDLIKVLANDGRTVLFSKMSLSSIKIGFWASKILVFDVETSFLSIIDLSGMPLLRLNQRATRLDNLDSSGYARIVCDGKAGLVDGDCNFVLPCRYEDVGQFGEGLVPAKLEGKWGFVELPGKWVLPARFDGARSFKDGYAPVCIGGKWGFIDKSGKAATPFAYEDVKDVREGHFRAQVNGKWGIFALDGTCKLPAEYDSILAEGEYGYGDP